MTQPVVTTHRVSLAVSAVLLCAALGVPAALDSYGKGARTSVAGGAAGKAMVAEPKDALAVWQGRGLRGRIVLFVGGRWPAVDADALMQVPLAHPYPLEVGNYAKDLVRQRLDSQTFLYLATQAGIARGILAVLPEEQFRRAEENARKAKHVERDRGYLFVPHTGFPRSFTMLKDLRSPGEPVLLYVAADYFTGCTAESLARRLKEAGIAADQAVLCEMRNDPSVPEAAREELRRFAALLGGA